MRLLNNKGASLAVIFVLSFVFLLAGIGLLKVISIESLLNITVKKSNLARQNAIKGSEESIAILKHALKDIWQESIKQGGTISYLRKIEVDTATSDYIEVDMDHEMLKDYLSNTPPGYSDFLYDCVYDPSLLPNDPRIFEKIDGLSAKFYHSETDVFESTITLTANTTLSKFAPGYGSNKGVFAYDYDIFTTGYSTSAASSYSHKMRIRSITPVLINFNRESFAKYALYTTTMLKNPAPVPSKDDYSIWYSPDASPTIIFRGPVFSGGHIYIKNEPIFAMPVTKLPACTIRDYDTDTEISPLSARFLTCFPSGVNDGSLTTDETVTAQTQMLQAKGSLNPASPMFVWQHPIRKAMYVHPNYNSAGQYYASIAITPSPDESQVRYLFTRNRIADDVVFGVPVQRTHSVDDEYLIYCYSAKIHLAGTIPKGAKITVACIGHVNIINQLRYSDNAKATYPVDDTVIGVISWNGDIKFKISNLDDAKTKAPQRYYIDGVYYCLNGGFGVWTGSGQTIKQTYQRPAGTFEKSPIGIIDFFGSIICKYFYRLSDPDTDPGITYGFYLDSKYDDALLYNKAPPYFPANGYYFIPDYPPYELRVLDSYRIARED